MLVWGMCIFLLAGCAGNVAIDGPLITSANISTTTTASALPSSTTTTEEANTSVSGTSSTATIDATQATTAPKTTVPTAKPTTTATTSSATKATTLTTTTTADSNSATVNGKVYAVGDTISYTVMVKTAENYGTVKIGIRCVQKGLEIPEGTFQKQNQAVMKNIGIGRLGTMPEETVGQNGFVMTTNKGYALDAPYAGYAGLLWFYETTNYDYDSLSYREIDCSKGVALFTIALKITKPGEYRVECMEYPQKSRTDLTVWGEITKITQKELSAMEEKQVLWKDRKRTLFGLPLSFTVYELTAEKLLITTGLFNLREEEIRLYRIVDVTLKRSFGERLFGLGTIHCCSADRTAPDFDIQRIKHSREVKEQLSELIEAERMAKRVSSREFLDDDQEGCDL